MTLERTILPQAGWRPAAGAIKRGFLHYWPEFVPSGVLIYFALSLLATADLIMTGDKALFSVGKAEFLLVGLLSLAHPGLRRGLLRAALQPAAWLLALFFGYFLVRAVTHPDSEVAGAYTRLIFTHLAVGAAAGYLMLCHADTVKSKSASAASLAGVALSLLALAACFFVFLQSRHPEFFMVSTQWQGEYYQVFGDYLVLLYVATIFILRTVLLRSATNAGHREGLWKCSLIGISLAFGFLAQLVGSNNAALCVGLMAVFCLTGDLFSASEDHAKGGLLVKLGRFLGPACVLGMTAWGIAAMLPPLRILDFQPVVPSPSATRSATATASGANDPRYGSGQVGGLSAQGKHPRNKSGEVGSDESLKLNSSANSRLQILFSTGFEQIKVAPIFGNLAAELVVGMPGRYIHSLLSVQSHLGIVGSALLSSFLLLGLTAAWKRRAGVVVLATAAAVILVSLAATFFTWFPFWFTAGLLLAAAGRPSKAELGPSTHLHVSMTPFRNESRVLKETSAVVDSGLADRVIIAALHEGDLRKSEYLDAHRQVIRIALATRGLPTNLVSQMLKYAEFAYRVGKLARATGAQAISIHTVALLPIGVAAKLLLGCRLVYDAHELETETQGRHGLRKRLTKIVERLLIGQVDLTVVVSPGIEAWYRKSYSISSIVTVLNAPHQVVIRRTDALRASTGIAAERKIILYQGGFTGGRGIKRLLEAAPALDRIGYSLVFMGYGELRPLIESVASTTDSVYLVPAVSPDRVMDYTMSADIGVCSIEDTCLSYRLSLPNKLFEYALAGVPVIASDLPEMSRLVQENRIGVCVSQWTPVALVEALQQIEAMRGSDLDARLRQVGVAYSWETQQRVLIRAYEQFVAELLPTTQSA